MATVNNSIIEEIRRSINGIELEQKTLEQKIETLRKMLENYQAKTDHLEKILLMGDGEKLPLAEIVRNLTNTVSDYITRKNKEEAAKKEQWDKLKWLIITPIVGAIFVFIGQALVFYFRVLPLLEKFSE